MEDQLFRGSLADLDPEVFELTEFEAERQYRRLILIPSESTSPMAVRAALATAFHNIYAEGYPPEYTRNLPEGELFNYKTRLAEFRRYSDPRYYKGVEYANLIEALARRRCAQTFAANGVTADDIFVNVQALSGAPANNAVYHALVEPGETIMGLDLLHGGHLSHGSPVNRSGKYYNAVHYSVDPATERIDYAAVEALAREHKPKFIIGGFSSYPWVADWSKFRAIADAVGAYLFADIAHVAGLVAAGAYPSPVGFADIITFTTHKSLCGPRGACILTTDRSLARKIDRAVFPGEQGGPHVNVFAALAVAFKLAQTDQFRQLQYQIIDNCVALWKGLEKRGFRIPFGGTNTHMMNLDCGSVTGPDGTRLSGDMAARILELAGIVVNRNTIPGDKSALHPSGIRLGTPWITQRGFKEAETTALAEIMADVLRAITPYSLDGRRRPLARAKVDFDVLEQAKLRVRDLALQAGIDFEPPKHGYPHFFYRDDSFSRAGPEVALTLGGERVREFLNFTVSSDIEALAAGESQRTSITTPSGVVQGTLTYETTGHFTLQVPTGDAGVAAAWLRALSDGYVRFDEDLTRKIPGPVWVAEQAAKSNLPLEGDTVSHTKPFFIGAENGEGTVLPVFQWAEPEEVPLRRTPLYDLHVELGAKIIPFAGWEMPVWYTSVVEEHLAVRQAAGLFDVAHMGVYQAEGPDAAVFLDSVCANDIGGLGVGESLYTHFLDPAANVIDDLLVYRRSPERYLVVVNASNDDKDWSWLNAVREGKVQIDSARPWTRAYGRQVTLRNLRNPQEGGDMRVDIALQGPRARDILLSLGCEPELQARIEGLKRTELCEGAVGGFDLIISRTGYTGEKMAFELFVHPDQSPAFFTALLAAGKALGIKPCGLGARDSLRTEAGLPLYGHEMSGEDNLGVGDAGFGAYVKTYKPWFIGRDAYLFQEAGRKAEVIRFKFSEKGVRMAHSGDPVLDKRGRTIGFVTSCAVDSAGSLTGQAYLEQKYSEIGTPIYIFQGADRAEVKQPAELKIGDRTVIPTAAEVVSRFPK
jgi:glycine hydroxymethyltransferase